MSGRRDLSSRAWKAQSARVLARDGACVDCTTSEDLTADHLEPFSVRKGRLEDESGRVWGDLEVAATYSDEELVTRCRSCNSTKGNRVGVRLDYRAAGWFEDPEERVAIL